MSKEPLSLNVAAATIHRPFKTSPVIKIIYTAISVFIIMLIVDQLSQDDVGKIHKRLAHWIQYQDNFIKSSVKTNGVERKLAED